MPFSGPIRTQWTPDGARMILLESVTYTDAKGKVWPAHAGFSTDGASIPQVLWSLIGSPYTGVYRTIAVFHDVAYSTVGMVKDEADLMLRDGALELGCPHWLAEALYTGVRNWGGSSFSADQLALQGRV